MIIIYAVTHSPNNNNSRQQLLRRTRACAGEARFHTEANAHGTTTYMYMCPSIDSFGAHSGLSAVPALRSRFLNFIHGDPLSAQARTNAHLSLRASLPDVDAWHLLIFFASDEEHLECTPCRLGSPGIPGGVHVWQGYSHTFPLR